MWRRGSALRGYLLDDSVTLLAIFSVMAGICADDSVGQHKTCYVLDSSHRPLALSCLRCCIYCRSSDDSDDDDDEDDDEAVKVVSMVCNVHRIACHCRLRAAMVVYRAFICLSCSCHNHDSGWLLYILRERGGSERCVFMVLWHIPSCADIFIPSKSDDGCRS